MALQKDVNSWNDVGLSLQRIQIRRLGLLWMHIAVLSRIDGLKSRSVNQSSPKHSNGALNPRLLPSMSCRSAIEEFQTGQNQWRYMKDTKPKPFLRWAGSKRQLLPILSGFWKDTHRRYIEPFAGSACLFFYLCPEKAILGDVNSELIEAYQQVQDNYEAVHSSLRSYKGGKEEYYQVRQTNPDDLDPVLRASRFIYLNRYCFNGLYRTNRKGFFNVPYGGTRTGRLPNLEELASVSCLLRKADLLNCDFESVIDRAKQGDFVYMDPPYKVESRRVFNEYDASVFVEADLERLKKQLESLSERGVDFLVSYAESEEANYLKKGFNCRQVTVRRNIAGFTSSRKSATEILITNCCILG